jgi:DNA-directed RNA polymerase subunit RPC12/RpoP|nr:MAG TPA: DNA-directed RNA polymerase [Caudoviricetes sp.]
MNGFYTIYKCKSCKREMILETEEVDKLVKNGHYLSCPFCKNKNLKQIDKYDSMVECYINSDKRR